MIDFKSLNHNFFTKAERLGWHPVQVFTLSTDFMHKTKKTIKTHKIGPKLGFIMILSH